MNSNNALTTWPPPFTLKKSSRSRSVKLKASFRYGLELIVPVRFNQKAIPEILETNKPWIEKQLKQIEAELKKWGSEILPNEIILPPLEQSYKVHYIKSDNKKLRLMTRPQQELVVFGDTDDKALCKNLLGAWVKKQAKMYLPDRLALLSQQTALSYSSVSIRNQRSRWGSCSTKKSINLSYKLLFLPRTLVDHIIIHELCHTKYMNHSSQFWRLVASYDPEWKVHGAEIRHAEKWIPSWAHGI